MRNLLYSRCSRRVFGFLFLLALSVGVVSRLTAQEAAPAAASAVQTVAPAAAPEAAKPEAAKTDKEKEDVFLLDGPIVKWTAKTFNVSRETAATIFEWANFAVLFFGIAIPLFRFLPKFLRKRAEKLRNDIESARKVTEDANARLSAVEAKLSGLSDEIAAFRAQVEAESAGDEARIKGTIAEESARIVAAAEQELNSAAAQATRSLRHFAADLAIDQAAKQLALTPEADKALITQFIADVNKGGLN